MRPRQGKQVLNVASVFIWMAALSALRVGCSQPVEAAEKRANAQPLTWAQDVAPILYKNCTSCHHPGGAGPFSLLTFAEARRWAPQVVKATDSRFMPPWLPEPGHGDFADVRRLSEEDRFKLRRWFESGMNQGLAKDTPKTPTYSLEWQLGKPDLILTSAKPFTLAAGGTDVFRNFIFPYPLKDGRYVRAMEIRPGAAAVVHHANVLIDRTGSFRHQHPQDWQGGIEGMELLVDAGNSFDPDSHFLFWKPDTPALVEPDGMPWRLDSGNDLVLNIHLKPSGKPESIDAQIGLYFTDKPPDKQPMLLQLDRDDALDIPAGAANFIVEDQLKLPIPVQVLGVYPHAHYLGKDMQAWATLPNGKKEWLVWIRDWDIDRQSIYRYRVPLDLPAGTMLHMRFVYDNSEANERNPHTPAVRVRAGNRSEDEMAHLWLQVLPASSVPQKPDPRLRLEEAWMRSRLKKTPGDRISLYNLGGALVGQGRFNEAVEVYELDRKSHPQDARTLTALGVALEGGGRWQHALERYREASENSGEKAATANCNGRFNLARLEQQREMFSEAVQDYRLKLAACEADAETYDGLGAALTALGQVDEAQTEFHRALELDPGNFTALYNLGVLALQGDKAGDAIGQFEAAVVSKPDSAEAHQRLAQAYGASGRVAEAVSHLREAERLAPDTAEIHGMLSQALAASGQLAEALSEARTGMRLGADDADGWNNLGVLEARAGNVEPARKDFERALALRPDHAEARANLGRLIPKS